MKINIYSFAAFLLYSSLLFSQSVGVGLGSYGTTLPSGAVGPQNSSGAPISPKVSSTFQKPAQTCDYWSSLIYPFYGNPFSNSMYVNPLNAKAVKNGLQIGYTTTPVFAAQDYLYPFSQQLTIGISGLNALKAAADDYGDWTVTSLWDDGTRKLKATFGHGLPFVFFTANGGDVSITCSAAPNIWYNQRGVIGLTVEGRHYGIFAPDSSSWTGTTTLQSSLNGKNYFSVALLPDNNTATLEFFRKHAYAFVTGSSVTWSYNKQTAKLLSAYTYTTELKESLNGNLNQTLTALYRHQWLNTNSPLTNFEYVSTSGKMKLFDGNEFTTELTFEGVLPALPDQGVYNPAELKIMLQKMSSETIPTSGTLSGTYRNGKLISRLAHLVNIADQLGEISLRDNFLAKIKSSLQEWFTSGGPQSYVYNSTWKTLTGYPSEFGADNQINDHNFHAGYAIMGAAIVAQYDSVWAAQENWGGMVNLIIKDANNWDRNDNRFPFLRGMDPYAGHSWESGHGDFGDGNNEESSSESMNFATAVILWGAATNQQEIRDLGIYLHATERSAIEQYWFDIDDAVFPAGYPYKALGMVWGGKGVHSTWFGANPDFIHGINMLPFNGGSMYLGRNVNYVKNNYLEVINELNGAAPTWKDILWQYQAFYNPGNALSMFFADSSYTPEEGETKAHTYHWLGNLKKMGRLDISITADIPTYSVFKNEAGEKTYIAYNPNADSLNVSYSDGFSMKVPPRKMRAYSNSNTNVNAPTAILASDKMSGKVPLTVSFIGSKSFDRNGSPITYSWNFGDNSTSTTADTLHKFTVSGSYKVILTVKNHLNLTSVDSVTITAIGNGTPYTGTPAIVPGTINAVNFDKGGEGIAYHDVDANNIGQTYRLTEGVDIESSSPSGYDVYWMVAGEWLEYTINVSTDGTYEIISSVATVPGFGNFRILIDNVDVSGKRQVTGTGGFQTWRPITVPGVPLKAGVHIMHFDINTDYETEKKNWLFSLKTIQFNKTGPLSVSDDMLPQNFTLKQNYPNPFNPVTKINFTLPYEARVTLKIFNSLGQQVALLKDDISSAGNHSLQFSPINLSSGIYFYELKAASVNGNQSFHEVKKMVYLK